MCVCVCSIVQQLLQIYSSPSNLTPPPQGLYIQQIQTPNIHHDSLDVVGVDLVYNLEVARLTRDKMRSGSATPRDPQLPAATACPQTKGPFFLTSNKIRCDCTDVPDLSLTTVGVVPYGVIIFLFVIVYCGRWTEAAACNLVLI